MDRPPPSRGISKFAAMAIAAIATAVADKRTPIQYVFPYIGPGGSGHASHWQGSEGNRKTARARAAKKMAHASRVRNRPRKPKKWSGKVTLKTRLYERNLNRLRLLEARTVTSGHIGSIIVEEEQ